MLVSNTKFMLAVVVMVTVALNSLFCLFLLHSRVFDCEEKHASGTQLCSAAEVDRFKADAIAAYKEMTGASLSTVVPLKGVQEKYRKLHVEHEHALLENRRLTDQLHKQTQATNDALARAAAAAAAAPGPSTNAHSPATQSTPPTNAVAAAAAAATPNSAIPFLIIGLPTVPRLDRRKGGEAVNYLGPTLDRLAEQMPSDPNHPMFGRVEVHVMNHDEPTGHKYFDEARTRFASNPSIIFHQNTRRLTDADAPANTFGPQSGPSDRVRKQTRDVVALLRAVHGRSRYYLFMEDDFAVCPHSLNILSYVINKAYTVDPNWLSIKVGYGLNGLILKNQPNGDLFTFGEYLYKHQRRRPPDHLATEWTAGETPESASHKSGRKHLAYRFNLMLHMGDVSAIRDSGQEKMPECFFELRFPILFEVDAFKKVCNHDDMWPCSEPATPASRRAPPFPLAPSVNPSPAYVDSQSSAVVYPPLRAPAIIWSHLPRELTPTPDG